MSSVLYVSVNNDSAKWYVPETVRNFPVKLPTSLYMRGKLRDVDGEILLLVL